jgi:hypothetical protein
MEKIGKKSYLKKLIGLIKSNKILQQKKAPFGAF